jgi:hypothetical protein
MSTVELRRILDEVHTEVRGQLGAALQAEAYDDDSERVFVGVAERVCLEVLRQAIGDRLMALELRQKAAAVST